LGIVGRNGSGKSTLLKLISGIIQPGSGKITVNGAVSALLELGSGLNPEFTGMQNIYFGGTMMGFSRKEMEEKIGEIVEFADIGEFIRQPLKTYSSGMKARLGFALASNMNPEILILDEVLSVGDELFRRKCFAKMEELFKSGCTVLYVSHSANTIIEICSRAILLDKGKLMLNGPPKMVTMYYQKLLFATQENALDVRKEILSLNLDEEKKIKFTLPVDPGAADRKKNQIAVNDQEKQEAFLIPGLLPKSGVTYGNYNVEIDDIHFSTLEGRKVNALVMNEEYIFVYNVIFNEDFENVYFTMSFKTLKGLPISGARLIGTNKKINVTAGDKYRVKWTFTCNLLPRTYFANLGVLQTIKEEKIILNAIADAAAFKVLPVPDLIFTGLVHLNQECNIYKL
jgi:lipopolysaccharide transport system ATP-binding protein